MMEDSLHKMTTIAQRNQDRITWLERHDAQIQFLHDVVILRHRPAGGFGDNGWHGISLPFDDRKHYSYVGDLIDMVLAAEKIECDAKSKFEAVEGGE